MAIVVLNQIVPRKNRKLRKLDITAQELLKILTKYGYG